MAASWKVHLKWKPLFRACDGNGNMNQVSQEDEQWLLNKVQSKFYAWVITTTASIVSKARHQLFYNTFIAR
jgi:hypothetical protein